MTLAKNSDDGAHWQCQEVAKYVYKIVINFNKRYPVLFLVHRKHQANGGHGV